MEIKAELNKPYTEKQRMDFIVDNNHKQSYKIKETETELQAWGYTEEEKQEQEHERIQGLSMTRSDFFDGMIRAFGLTEHTLKPILLDTLNELSIDWEEICIAVNNFENALNFYRNHMLFTILSGIELCTEDGNKIVITSEQWDKFFDETAKKNPEAYKELLS